MSIRHPRALLSLVLGSMLLAGCVKTGSVTVSQPVDAKVARYDTIVVSAATEQSELQKYVPKLQESVAQGLQKDKVFASATAGTSASEGAVMLRMHVKKTTEGSKLARTMNLGGEVEVEVACELVDESTQTTLARFVAKGNSARKSKTSVNGFDTSIADDLDGRAVRAAGEQIVTFLEENAR
jgi:hypothetical protein